jgi:hypothetical protein
MRITSVTLTELDDGQFNLSHISDGGWRGGATYHHGRYPDYAPLPRSLHDLHRLMRIHEIPTATINTLTEGEREVTLEEVIHMRQQLKRMIELIGL